MLELWRMGSTSSFLSRTGPLWPGGVTLGRIRSMGQIEMCTYAKLNCLKLTVFPLNVCVKTRNCVLMLK